MKKLKITINGEVKTFDLPENGEYKCEVTESYVPKVGDCVTVNLTEHNVFYWYKITDITTTLVNFKLSVNSRLEIISKNGIFNTNKNRIYTKITPKELKAKYAEAGYDWDYETDTIKPIKWMPEDGDSVWYSSIYMEVQNFTFRENNYIYKKLLEKGNLFPNKEECQKFADHCWSYFDNK